ncbi:MAG: VWA domain-containing protein [Thermoanaerobaculia bacterium]|nr:VWA domain-containing protein [Thermoanaerobaculia bacterium]
MKTRSPLLALATLLLLLPSLGGQSPPDEEGPPPDEPRGAFEEEVEVVEVLVDVLATDRRGDVVRGLTAEDFEIEVEGEPVEITDVTFYTTRYSDLDTTDREEDQPFPGGESPTVPASRYFIFFFHDQKGAATDPGDLMRNQLDAAREAHRWVRDEMAPSDWIAVVRYDLELTVHADFTQHRGTILAAIEEAVTNAPSRVMRPSARRRAEGSKGPSLLRGLPDSFRLEDAAPRVYEAVTLVAEATGSIVGRKNLILFTLGFGSVDSAFASPDSRYYPPMEEALNANNVAVYPIDLVGKGNVDSRQTSFLSQLADDTGGELFKTFNRYLTPLRRISDHSTGYYLISFRVEQPIGESGYRTIDVDTTRGGVRVKSRRGYRFEPSAEREEVDGG